MNASTLIVILAAFTPASFGQTLLGGSGCTQDSDCTSGSGGANSECKNGTCVCQTGYYDNNGDTAAGVCDAGCPLNANCSGPSTTELKNTCCTTITANSECGTGDKCLCKTSYLGDGSHCNTKCSASTLLAGWTIGFLSLVQLFWTLF